MATPPTLDESFLLKGTWWIPEASQQRLHGVLSYAPEQGCTLDLAESIDHTVLLGKTGLVIHGMVEDGREVTAWNCFIVERRFGATAPMKIACDRVVVGHHFMPTDKIFRYLEVNFTGLTEWLGGDPIVAKWGKKRHEALQKAPRGWRLKLPRTELTLSPQFDATGSLTGDHYRLSLETVPFLRLEPKERQDIDSLISWQWLSAGSFFERRAFRVALITAVLPASSGR